jgi:hypothetical protein
MTAHRARSEDAGICMGKEILITMGYYTNQKTYENALDLINESLEATPDARGCLWKGDP